MYQQQMFDSPEFEEKRRETKEMYEFLQSIRTWNDFAHSLLEFSEHKGYLTDAQRNKAVQMMHNMRTKAQPLNLEAIQDLFKSAKANGIASPKLRMKALTLSLAPSNSRNPGCIYVKDNGEYAGKISPDGNWYSIKSARVDILSELKTLSQKPFEYLAKTGKETGMCSCCGRSLTNKRSIELGIGPVCRTKWGI